MSLLSTSVPAIFSPVTLDDKNDTNSTRSTLHLPDWSYSVLPVYIIVITVLGIVFNVFVLMVFCLHKRACTVAEIYLSNLAAADLILVSCLPFWAVNVANKYNWQFSGSLCRLVNLSILINVYCSIYFLVLISIDRYMAVVHPLSCERLRNPKFAKMGCLLVWSLGLLLSVPALVYRKLKHEKNNITRCSLIYPDNIAIVLLFEGMLTTFSFIIPIIIISICTFKIIQTLNNRLTKGLNSRKTEQKTNILILSVLLAFLICWMPFHLLKITEMLIRANILDGRIHGKNVDMCKQIFINVAYFNSVLNPILYVLVGKNFQKKVKELLSQWGCRTERLGLTNTVRTSLSRSIKTTDVDRKPVIL